MTQRLSNAKEAANKPAFQSHEDLARKLQVNIFFIQALELSYLSY